MKTLLKNNVLSLPVLMFCAAINTLCVACASAPTSVAFTEVQGKEWKLIEVRAGPENIIFDRNQLISEGFADIFILQFENDRLQGKGAPNRYSAPYEQGKGQDLAIKSIAGTLMAPIREPEKLKEHNYFIYLQNTYRWNINNNNLELFTKSEDGQEVVMVFVAE
jgi:heat shock protein HslJ